MQSARSPAGFPYIAIRAPDLIATGRLYTDGMRFRIHFPFSVPGRIDRAAFLDAGDGRFVEIFGHTSTVQSEGRRRRPDEDRTEGALLHFCLRVAHTDAAYARAITCGANPRVEPVSRQLSADPLVQVRIAFVTGPNGEVMSSCRAGRYRAGECLAFDHTPAPE